MVEVFCDGVTEPVNPGGYAAYGIVVLRDKIELLREGKFVGNGSRISNNVAEYSGFIRALEFLKENNLHNEQILVRADSKLVIEQMLHNWQIRQGLYVPLALKALKLLKDFKNLKLQWIPREENGICDCLSKDVLKKMGIKFRIQPELA